MQHLLRQDVTDGVVACRDGEGRLEPQYYGGCTVSERQLVHEGGASDICGSDAMQEDSMTVVHVTQLT